MVGGKFLLLRPNQRIWAEKPPSLSLCWASFCSSLRVLPTGRQKPCARPSVRWRRWKNSRRSSTTRPSRRTINIRPKRPKKWSKKTKNTPKRCVGSREAIRFSPNSNRFSTNSNRKFHHFHPFLTSNRKKSKKNPKNFIHINDYISKCCIGFQKNREEKNV